MFDSVESSIKYRAPENGTTWEVFEAQTSLDAGVIGYLSTIY